MKIFYDCFDWGEGDLDNIAKPILDALSGSAFFNDSQVVELLLRRTDLKQHKITEVFDAPNVLIDQLQECLQTQEGFVYISISDEDTDHARLR